MTEIIIPTKKKNIVLDATVLTSFMACECLTDYRYNLHFQSIGGKANALECGSLVHRILETFYQEQIKGFERGQCIISGMASGLLYIQGCRYCTDFVPTECIAPGCNGTGSNGYVACDICNGTGNIDKPLCGHQINEYPGLQNTPAECQANPKRTGYTWVMDTMEQYFQRWKNEAWVCLETERVRGKIVYEDDNIRVMWKAKLDTIMDTLDGIFPCDHKTMQQNRKNVSLNNQFMGQCLIAGTRMVIINKIGFQKLLKPEEKFKREGISYTASRLMEWQSEILPYHAYRLLECNETGHWPRRLTHCVNQFGTCPFTKVCESDPEDRERVLRADFMVGEAWDPVNLDGDIHVD